MAWYYSKIITILFGQFASILVYMLWFNYFQDDLPGPYAPTGKFVHFDRGMMDLVLALPPQAFVPRDYSPPEDTIKKFIAKRKPELWCESSYTFDTDYRFIFIMDQQFPLFNPSIHLFTWSRATDSEGKRRAVYIGLRYIDKNNRTSYIPIRNPLISFCIQKELPKITY
jgi:hypothetical protein